MKFFELKNFHSGLNKIQIFLSKIKKKYNPDILHDPEFFSNLPMISREDPFLSTFRGSGFSSFYSIEESFRIIVFIQLYNLHLN